MIFFPSLQYILTVHERHCGFSRWPDATTECYLHCLRSWPQRSSASWHCAQLSLCFPPSNPWVVQYWESWVLMVVVVWRLSAFETCETDEQKKKKPNPKAAGSVCEILRFPSKSEFLLPLALAVDWSWGRSVLARYSPETWRKYCLLSYQRVLLTKTQSRHQTASYLKKREA